MIGVYVTETDGVYCGVRNTFLNTVQVNFIICLFKEYF